MAPRHLELDRFVPYRLSVLSNVVSRAFALLYAERFDLAIPQWRVLAVLGMAAPQSAGEEELVGTNFERKFRQEGRSFHACVLRKRDGAVR